MSLNTASIDEEDRPPCTQQESSLGISQALKATPGAKSEGKTKSALRDDTFREVSESDNFLIWARFYISLYYNKVRVIL